MALFSTTIKSFSQKRGWGFLHNPQGGGDIYFKKDRQKAVEGNCLRDFGPSEKKPKFKEGDTVRFCVRDVKGKPQAIEFGVVPCTS